jgi:hypothetical protein
MELSTEQQLGYVFEQFTDDSEENPGRIVAIERALGEIRDHLTHHSELTWSRFLFDVGKGISIVVCSSVVLSVLALLAWAIRAQSALAGGGQ